MTRSTLKTATALIALACLCCGSAGEQAATDQAEATPGLSQSEVEAQALARTYTDDFYRKQLELIHEQFSPEMKIQMPLQAFVELRGQVDTYFGNEVELVGEETVTDKNGYIRCTRFARFDKFTDGLVEVTWLFRDGLVAGIFVKPVQIATPSGEN